MLGLFLVSPAWAEESMVFSVNSLSEFKIGQHPFISGTAKDNDGNPLPNVEIQAIFPSRIMLETTNSAGEFSIASPIAVEETGEHTITVYATKGTINLKTQVNYQVIDNQRVTTDVSKNADPEENNSKNKKYDNSKYDLLSRTILEKVEEQKEKEVKEKEIVKKQHQIDEQRMQAEAKLQEDLKDSEKRMAYYSPRNAFYRFIADVDSSIRGIFWQQFLFTEKLTKDAHDAKENALDEGKSSFEAMKIFQEKAKVTQNEIMDFNKNLNIQYGNATSDIQDQFDEKGKLSREE